ncbi:hypothetical protein [Marinicella rhabdoformis]|uniref:hypothetical protein n=1 Tax=Marinicella rhabdoformis TaxID=2580566 RepID=UPI0012AEDDD5|nr:hypothetical protein [Marinicella rhabdoformis]
MKMILKAVLFTIVVVLTGCSESTETIEEKVVNRWQAIVDSDYEKAYSYLSPSYREVESLTSYSVRIETAKINVKWEKPKFISKQCDKEVCDVELTLKVTYSFPRKSMGSASIVSPISEKWVKKSDGWYHVPTKK